MPERRAGLARLKDSWFVASASAPAPAWSCPIPCHPQGRRRDQAWTTDGASEPRSVDTAEASHADCYYRTSPAECLPDYGCLPAWGKPFAGGDAKPLQAFFFRESIAGSLGAGKQAHGVAKTQAGIGCSSFRSLELFEKLRHLVAIDFHPPAANELKPAGTGK